MKNKLSVISFIAATIGMASFADNGLFILSMVCLAYMILWGYAQTKRPNAATKGRENQSCKTEILDFYSKSKTTKSQAQKIWTANGSMITVMHFEEGE